MKTKKLVITFW